MAVCRAHRMGRGKNILLGFLLVGYLVQSLEAVPSREILKSNRKVVPSKLREDNTEIAKLSQISNCIGPIINLITAIPTAIIGTIGNLTTNATSSLGSLFKKPGGGGGGGLFPSKNGTTCSPIDPLLIANLPGVFIAVPIVIVGIAILIGIIAAIVIAIGGLGGEITKNAYDEKYANQDSGGYAPSVMPMYGTPVSSYGSPAASSSAYSRLAQNVDTATQDFNQAYDKYTGLLSQPQQPQQQQQASSVYFDDKENQYDGWNNNVVMKRAKQ